MAISEREGQSQEGLLFTERFPQAAVIANEARLFIALQIGIHPSEALTIARLQRKINNAQGLRDAKQEGELGIRQQFNSIQSILEDMRMHGLIKNEGNGFVYVNREMQLKTMTMSLELLSMIKERGSSLRGIVIQPPGHTRSVEIFSAISKILSNQPATTSAELVKVMGGKISNSKLRNEFIHKWAELGILTYTSKVSPFITKGKDFAVIERILQAAQLTPEYLAAHPEVIANWVTQLVPGFHIDLNVSLDQMIAEIAAAILQNSQTILEIMEISKESSKYINRVPAHETEERILSAIAKSDGLTSRQLHEILVEQDKTVVTADPNKLRFHLERLKEERLVTSYPTRNTSELAWKLSESTSKQLQDAREQILAAVQTRELSREEIQRIVGGRIFQEHPELVREMITALKQERSIRKIVTEYGEKWGKELVIQDPNKAWQKISEAINHKRKKIGVIIYNFSMPQDLQKPTRQHYQGYPEHLLFIDGDIDNASEITQEDLPQDISLMTLQNVLQALRNNSQEKKPVPVGHELVMENRENNRMIIVFDTSHARFDNDRNLILSNLGDSSWPYAAIVQGVAHRLVNVVEVPDSPYRPNNPRQIRRDGRSLR